MKKDTKKEDNKKNSSLFEIKENIKKEIMGNMYVPSVFRTQEGSVFANGTAIVNVAIVDLDKLAEFLAKSL